MGNRGTVIFTNGEDRFSPAIYLHWNGGPDSVYPFLDELDRRQVRPDQEYEAARFIAIVSEFFDTEAYGGLSLGVVNGPRDQWDLDRVQTDHGDNGIYLVDRTKPEGREVRRFKYRRYSSAVGDVLFRLAELSPEGVEAEHREWCLSDTGKEYARGIAATYEGKEVKA